MSRELFIGNFYVAVRLNTWALPLEVHVTPWGVGFEFLCFGFFYNWDER